MDESRLPWSNLQRRQEPLRLTIELFSFTHLCPLSTCRLSSIVCASWAPPRPEHATHLQVRGHGHVASVLWPYPGQLQLVDRPPLHKSMPCECFPRQGWRLPVSPRFTPPSFRHEGARNALVLASLLVVLVGIVHATAVDSPGPVWTHVNLR